MADCSVLCSWYWMHSIGLFLHRVLQGHVYDLMPPSEGAVGYEQINLVDGRQECYV